MHMRGIRSDRDVRMPNYSCESIRRSAMRSRRRFVYIIIWIRQMRQQKQQYRQKI